MAADYYKNHPYNRGSSRHHGPPAGQPVPGQGYGPGYYSPGQDNDASYSDSRPKEGGRHRRSHSAGGEGRHRGRSRYDEYDEEPRRSKHRHKNSSRYTHSVSPPSRSPSPLRPRKSLGDHALEALGLTGAMDDARKHGDRGQRRRHEYDDDHRDRRSHNRHRYDYDDRRQESGRGKHRRNRSSSSDRRGHGSRDDPNKTLQNTITAALTAGVLEAYRARNEPGDWTGEKGKRVLAAVASAGGTEKMLDRGGASKSTKRHIIESTLAGLATGHLVGGGDSGRHRSHSEHHGKASTGATAALLAAAGKKAFEHYQSRSRDSGKHDYYSDDDRPGRSGRSNRKRSKSLSDYVAKGMATLGLDERGRDSGHSNSHGNSHDNSHRRRRSRYSSPPSDYESDYSDRPRRRKRHHDRY
ncbi:hypothetical protein MGYG_06665 [Nannizzia gypsea CBS 118893]|uniref:Uncharacterized protein n=1 Tax=Arthroderma gypseum (strain ATCC MYA-4604 / CBS 118893) TaxID=535722 RepID=E4V0V4_ARTGP|nr:hypothetical protein MGYG_06665 [Nannizzia gypsea CBS 118893]EFR03669.1 hypothetical protein MGYG_06665 [Nannizzia gypsea CBS 118893]